MPLVITGRPVSSTRRSAASSAPSDQTSVPSTSTGRPARASSAPIDEIASGSGATRSRGLTSGVVDSHSENSWSMGTSTNVGPRCGDDAIVNASCMPSAIAPTSMIVRACFVTGARIGGWSSS